MNERKEASPASSPPTLRVEHGINTAMPLSSHQSRHCETCWSRMDLKPIQGSKPLDYTFYYDSDARRLSKASAALVSYG